jgi:hypothetical protein
MENGSHCCYKVVLGKSIKLKILNISAGEVDVNEF